MIKKLQLSVFLLLVNFYLFGQVSLDYYLPDDTGYSEQVPVPASVIGHDVGQWHITHDKLVYYMRELAKASDRVVYQEYGKTWEDRPQVMLTISSPENLARLDEIKARHNELFDPQKAASANIADMPVVVWMGYSIHGNEPSGANAAPVVAYYMAAAESEEVQEMLQNTIILLDPAFNPDGLQRFSTWANSHKSYNLVTDPDSREFSEVWPRGRTNHYWFDLNRDWLPVQHPESRARVQKFHEWHPNILTDHHEMGTNSTFFFQPGVPSRKNPITPDINQQLTGKIAEYHSEALDEIGSLYYTKEGFDDFYYGKGSTYPDAQGTIGILFEQASSRGHAQNSTHGVLTFPFTIRNQFTTSLSTLRAANGLKDELMAYRRDFYREARQRADSDEVKAYVFGSNNDPARNYHLLDILGHHRINVYQLARDLSAGGENFEKGNAWVVPLKQAQYSLIKGIFTTQTSFKDSLFYDVSSWTLPLSFNLPWAQLNARSYNSGLLGEQVQKAVFPEGKVSGGRSEVGYVFPWDSYYAPRALYRLLNNGIKAKVATKPFTLKTPGGEKEFTYGAVIVPAGLQERSPEQLFVLMQDVARKNALSVHGISSGLATAGVDLGSGSFEMLRKPRVAILTGDGVSSYEVGEVWHLFDQRYDIPLSMLDAGQAGRVNLDKYNTLVMVSGSYGRMGERGREAIKAWLREGNTLVLTKSAVQWARSAGITSVQVKTTADSSRQEGERPYASYSNDRGSKRIGGAIFQVRLDLTHPVAYGFSRGTMPVFRNHETMYLPHKNPYATPVRYTDSPLLSGYITGQQLEQLKNSAAVMVDSFGRGKIISMADNPNFRAFWFGTNKLFANAVFFGHTISGGASE